MVMGDWRFIYDPKSDSWELITDQAFATKELAEEFMNEIDNLKSKLANADNYKKMWEEKTNLLNVATNKIIELQNKADKNKQTTLAAINEELDWLNRCINDAPRQTLYIESVAKMLEKFKSILEKKE